MAGQSKVGTRVKFAPAPKSNDFLGVVLSAAPDQEPSVANGRFGEVEKIEQAQVFYRTPERSWPAGS